MHKRFYGGLFVLLLGSFLIAAAALGNRPDFDLILRRELPAKSDAAFLGGIISETQHWHLWIRNLADVQVMNAATGARGSKPAPGLSTGQVLKLTIDSKKTPWSHLDLVARVEEFIPSRKVRLRIIEDSSGKLSRLFDRIDWVVEVLPDPKGKAALIRGESSAHTANWRSRLFGTVATNIVLHQIYYPNLLKLAELTPQIAKDPSLANQTEGSLLLGPPPARSQAR